MSCCATSSKFDHPLTWPTSDGSDQPNISVAMRKNLALTEYMQHEGVECLVGSRNAPTTLGAVAYRSDGSGWPIRFPAELLHTLRRLHGIPIKIEYTAGRFGHPPSRHWHEFRSGLA